MAIRDINLVDSGILFHRHLRRHQIFWVGCLVAALVLVGGFYVFQAYANASQKSGRRSSNQMHADLKLKIKDINRLQAELENLRRQQHAMETLTTKQPFHGIFVNLAGIMNADTWLTDLNLDGGRENGAGTRLKLTGFSRSNEDLGDFMNRLAHEPMFEAVELQFAREKTTRPSKQNTGDDVQQIQFQINCSIGQDI